MTQMQVSSEEAVRGTTTPHGRHPESTLLHFWTTKAWSDETVASPPSPSERVIEPRDTSQALAAWREERRPAGPAVAMVNPVPVPVGRRLVPVETPVIAKEAPVPVVHYEAPPVVEEAPVPVVHYEAPPVVEEAAPVPVFHYEAPLVVEEAPVPLVVEKAPVPAVDEELAPVAPRSEPDAETHVFRELGLFALLALMAIAVAAAVAAIGVALTV